MQIFEKIKKVEDLISDEIERASTLSERGINNPEILNSKLDGYCSEMLGFCQSKIISLEDEKIDIEKRLQPIKNQITDSETLILNEWNKKGKTVSNRAEAEASIRMYLSENNFKKKDLIFYVLFLAEFSYGYYIFKNIVLPDNNIQNYITSVVVGAMVLLIGIFAKLIPDSQTDIKKYELFKKINSVLSGVSMVAFLICLVQMRETTNTFDMTKSVGKIETFNYQELVFNLSLLCTIIFGSAFFNHWHRSYPKKLLKKKHDEGMELLQWYESDHFYYKKATSDFKEAFEKLEKQIKPQLSILKEQISKYDQTFMKSIKRQALSQFMIGTYTIPMTSEKEVGRNRAESILTSLN